MTCRRSSPNRSERLACRAFAGLALLVACGCRSSPRPRSNAALPSAADPPRATPPRAAAPALPLEYVGAMTGGAAASDPEPLVVALHGLGDRPEHFIALFRSFSTKARIIAPHSRTAYGDGFEWFAPVDPKSDAAAGALAKMADDVARFAEQARVKLPTLGKPIVLGFSQGAALSYAVAVRHPDAIAASFPISGWLPPPLWPTVRPPNPPPIFSFHGTADTVVPLERDRPGVTRLEGLRFPIHFAIADGVEHQIPSSVREQVFAELAKECDLERREGAP